MEEKPEALVKNSENQRTKPAYTLEFGHQNRDTREDPALILYVKQLTAWKN